MFNENLNVFEKVFSMNANVPQLPVGRDSQYFTISRELHNKFTTFLSNEAIPPCLWVGAVMGWRVVMSILTQIYPQIQSVI